MSVQAISVSTEAFRMTEEEIITFEFDFVNLIPQGVAANGQSSRIIEADTGLDVSANCLIGTAQRTGSTVSQVVGYIARFTTYILVLTVHLSNTNKRSGTIMIEGYV